MDTLRHKILGLRYRLWPPSLAGAVKTGNMLSPGSDLIYYAIYTDGCIRQVMRNGDIINEGLRHAPHLAFVAGDVPVYEWRAG